MSHVQDGGAWMKCVVWKVDQNEVTRLNAIYSILQCSCVDSTQLSSPRN